MDKTFHLQLSQHVGVDRRVFSGRCRGERTWLRLAYMYCIPPSYTTDHSRHGALRALIYDRFLVIHKVPRYKRQLHGSAGQPTKIGHRKHAVACKINNRHTGTGIYKPTQTI